MLCHVGVYATLYNNAVDGFDLWIITLDASQFVIKYVSLHEL